MSYEIIEAIKREFWPQEKKEEVSEEKPAIEVREILEEKNDLPKCDYCSNGIDKRAYRIHGKLICSPCLNSRFDKYTETTFKKITNKPMSGVNKL